MESHGSESSIAKSDDNDDDDDDDDDDRMHMDVTMKHSVALKIITPDVIRLEGGLPELSFAWRFKAEPLRCIEGSDGLRKDAQEIVQRLLYEVNRRVISIHPYTCHQQSQPYPALPDSFPVLWPL